MKSLRSVPRKTHDSTRRRRRKKFVAKNMFCKKTEMRSSRFYGGRKLGRRKLGKAFDRVIAGSSIPFLLISLSFSFFSQTFWQNTRNRVIITSIVVVLSSLDFFPYFFSAKKNCLRWKKVFLGGLKQKSKTVNFSVVAFVIFSTKKKHFCLELLRQTLKIWIFLEIFSMFIADNNMQTFQDEIFLTFP